MPAASLEHLSDRFDHARAGVLGRALDDATTEYLMMNKSPSRRVNEIDNRGSHFYLATYWAKALSQQSSDALLAKQFTPVFEQLSANETAILDELNGAQGGRNRCWVTYAGDRPGGGCNATSPTLNKIIDAI